MTERTGFVLHVRPERVDDYLAAHRNVWPEMLDALHASGVRNYTIFDLEASGRYLAAQEVSTRWQDSMAELLEERVPDGGPPALEEIFRLD